MRTRILGVFLLAVSLVLAISGNALAAQQEAPPITTMDDETTPSNAAPPPAPGWLSRDTLTGDWGGGRSWLKEHGITLYPRLTQLYQGMAAGDGDHKFEYGGKADLKLNADLSKLGFWSGFSLTVQAEYNFGHSVSGQGGTLYPVNTALLFPGLGANAFDVSSVYVSQTFGNSVSLTFGKINMIDIYASKAFSGGAGIDSFWNIAFAAPPSGTVPPYLFGALLSVRTKPANFSFWVYDPESVNNRSVFDPFFPNGVTFRGSVSFPVTIADQSGHQALVALYTSQSGLDLRDLVDLIVPPPPPGTLGIKSNGYYFAYAFDQFLFQSKENPKEGVGLFGQVGISDGNPNRLYWSGHIGVGGTGLIPGRSRDNWGAAYYYAVLSKYLKQALAPVLPIRGEQGLEIFYNFSVTRWLDLGADLQVIRPFQDNNSPAVFPGLRTVIRF